MNVSGSGNAAGAGSRKGRPAAKRAYDRFAGAAVLRRTGKADPADEARRGDPAAALLAARRKSGAEDRIALQLRAYYQSLASEPVPERIMALIESLEAGSR